MQLDFASLRYLPPTVAAAVLNEANGPSEVIGERLGADAVIELWEERSAIQETDNLELVKWWQSLDRAPMSLRRYCDLCAVADLSIAYGTYVEPIVRPLVADS